MKILYYDCFAGISGDMNLAAMIDLGVDPGLLRAELSKLGLDHEFELLVSADARHGIHGTRVDVALKNRGGLDRETSPDSGQANASPANVHAGLAGGLDCSHEHVHAHEQDHRRGHDHAYGHTHEHAHAHEHGREQSHTHSHAHEHVHTFGHGHVHAHEHFHEHSHAHVHENGHGHAHDHAHERRHAHDHAHEHGHSHGHVHANAHAYEHVHSHAHEHAHEHDHTHAHAHEHEHADHTHAHDHAHAHVHGHAHGPHRNLGDIESLIMGSALPDAVKRTSLAIFRKVAEAEAKVHAKPIHEVHFHEVGATDSIVDIVGAAICLQVLGVDAVWSSPVELGGGFVRCAHGLVPVPAPATVEILRGVPTTRGAARHETATPTGAAIVAALAEAFPSAPALTVEKTGYGVGHRNAEIPNVLRVHLARAEPLRQGGAVRSARLLQCNIDDMTAEMLGVAMDVLMDKGAMDVHFTPIVMKKNRPATCVSLLCAPEDEERFKALLFRHTTTAGVKSITLEKSALEVSFRQLETPLGPVAMKSFHLEGEVLRTKPELEDCRKLAELHDIPLAEVYARIGKCLSEGDDQ